MTDAELRLACLDRALRVAMTSDAAVDVATKFHDFVRAASPAQPERGPDGKFRKPHIDPQQASAAADEAHAAMMAPTGRIDMVNSHPGNFGAPDLHNEAQDVFDPVSRLGRWFKGI